MKGFFCESSVRRAWSYFKYRKNPKVIFVWIPKNAGSSFYQWMKNELGMVKLKYPTEFRQFGNAGAVTFSHVHYLSLLDSKYVSRRYHNSAFKFAVSRNPYQRAVSLFNYLCSVGKYSGAFVEFLSDVRMNRTPVGFYNSLGLSQTNPQVDWLLSEDGGFIVDKIYRIDELGKAVDEIRGRFQLSGSSEVGRENVTRLKRDAVELLHSHSECIPMIREIYLRDFELLDYSLDDLG